MINRALIYRATAENEADNILIHTRAEVLNSMGLYFETINAPRCTNIGSALQLEVDQRAHALTAEFHRNATTGSVVATFSAENPASDRQIRDEQWRRGRRIHAAPQLNPPC